MITIKNQNYFTLNEVAEMFGVKVATVTSWRHKKLLKGTQLTERKYIFHEDDLEAFIKENKS